MFLKALMLIVFIAAVAVVLLGYRQERLEVMNQMVHLHTKIDQSRQEMWDLQLKIAGRVDPAALNQAIERAQLKLEPTTPMPVAPVAPTPVDGQTPRPANQRLPQHQMTDAGNPTR